MSRLVMEVDQAVAEVRTLGYSDYLSTHAAGQGLGDAQPPFNQ